MMLGFGFDVPQGDLMYQVKVPVHVIEEIRLSSLTPQLKPPPIVIKRVYPEKRWTVYFDFDSYFLKKSEKKKLEKIKGAVRVKGYASPEGSEEYNLKLSKKRAESVAEFLKKRGVRVLKVEGLGERSCSLSSERWSFCRKVEVEGK